MTVSGGRQVDRRVRERVMAGVLVVLVMIFAVVVTNPGAAEATGLRVRWFIDDVLDLVGVGGPDYAFLRMSDAGQPAHWDHCEPIYYSVNPALAPADWESIVVKAVDATAAASGFDFRDVGTTDDREFIPSARGSGAPVLIAWASAGEAPILMGGRVGYGSFASYPSGDDLVAVSGTVVLDAGAYAQMNGTEGKKEAVEVLEHELGHVLGLDHVDDIDEVMYPRYAGQDGFGPGDIKGFEVLFDQPCAYPNRG